MQHSATPSLLRCMRIVLHCISTHSTVIQSMIKVPACVVPVRLRSAPLPLCFRLQTSGRSHRALMKGEVYDRAELTLASVSDRAGYVSVAMLSQSHVLQRTWRRKRTFEVASDLVRMFARLLAGSARVPVYSISTRWSFLCSRLTLLRMTSR